MAAEGYLSRMGPTYTPKQTWKLSKPYVVRYLIALYLLLGNVSPLRPGKIKPLATGVQVSWWLC